MAGGASPGGIRDTDLCKELDDITAQHVHVYVLHCNAIFGIVVDDLCCRKKFLHKDTEFVEHSQGDRPILCGAVEQGLLLVLLGDDNPEPMPAGYLCRSKSDSRGFNMTSE